MKGLAYRHISRLTVSCTSLLEGVSCSQDQLPHSHLGLANAEKDAAGLRQPELTPCASPLGSAARSCPSRAASMPSDPVRACTMTPQLLCALHCKRSALLTEMNQTPYVQSTESPLFILCTYFSSTATHLMTCKGVLPDVTIRVSDHLFLSSRPASSPSAAEDALQTSVEATILMPSVVAAIH